MERVAILPRERAEELVLELFRDRAETLELALAVRGDADDVTAAVLRIALPRDQPPVLERVEDRDEPAGIEIERTRDRRLRLAGALALKAIPSRAMRKPLLATSSFATRETGRSGASGF